MKIENPVSELQYPIGKFLPKEDYAIEETLQSIDNISKLPALYNNLVGQIKNNLDETYREGSWTGLQVLNHLADTYLNAILRTKWLLTEDNCQLKPYIQDEFSKLADSTYDDVDATLQLLELLINRWVFLLRSIPKEKYSRSIYHPEYKTHYTLPGLIAMYDWHGYHHLAHLQIIKNKS